VEVVGAAEVSGRWRGGGDGGGGGGGRIRRMSNAEC
jgi:hypothetical protein